MKTLQSLETDCCQNNVLRCLRMLFLDLHVLGLYQTSEINKKRHLIIIILDFPSGESGISFNKRGYDPRQVTFLTGS